MKLGDGGGGEDGLKRLGKRSADDDSLEGEGPGGGDAADESGGTKRDARTPPGRRRRPPSARGRPAGPAPLPPVQREAAEQEAQEGLVVRRGQRRLGRLGAARQR